MLNAAGLDVRGENNPNWKGGKAEKVCHQCGTTFFVKRARSSAKFCSMQCVGKSQRGQTSGHSKKISKSCYVCNETFDVYPAHEYRFHCCSKSCSHKRRAELSKGKLNPSWAGGVSRLPYPWNFNEISKSIIKRDGGVCQNPNCRGGDERMTTHHIDYNKMNCAEENLICVCSSCNSRANFGREQWRKFYSDIAVRKQSKKAGGGFVEEHF